MKTAYGEERVDLTTRAMGGVIVEHEKRDENGGLSRLARHFYDYDEGYAWALKQVGGDTTKMRFLP